MPVRHDGSYNTALASDARFRYDAPSANHHLTQAANYAQERAVAATGLRERQNKPMPKYIIEREIPKVGMFTPEQLQQASQKSCGVLHKLGPSIQWLHSHVTGDKMYCLYIAPDEAAIHEHARLGGFPANRVSRVKAVIDPTTAEL
jgi:hypothetical protein